MRKQVCANLAAFHGESHKTMPAPLGKSPVLV